MLELGQGTDAAADLIKDGSEATFLADVIEMSQTVPVIVDFWAPWCGPCKTLGPALEAAVEKARGAVKMVKINVDEAQGLAGQMQIQSIPTVYAFWKGQPVDGFQGAVPGSEIDAFVARIVEASGGSADGGLSDAVEAAEAMLEAGDVMDAVQTFTAILGEDNLSAASYGGLARCHLALDQVDEAEAVLNGAPAEISDAAEIAEARAQIALARQAQDAGPVAELRAAVEADADDHQARFDLAAALPASGETEAAVDELLELFRRDRNWNDEAAKTQLFTIFEALSAKDPIALTGRRRLSSMIFA